MMRYFLVLFCLFFSFPALAETHLRVECPQSVGIGLPFMVQVESPRPMEELQVEWADKKFKIPGHNATLIRFWLGTDVLKSSPGTHGLRITKLGLSPLSMDTQIKVTQRQFPEQRLTVSQDMVTPPAEVLDRIKRENILARKVLGAVSEDNHLTLPLIRPVPGVVTSAYGLTRFFNDQPRNPHRGLDLRAALGDPILAAAPGQVVLADDLYYAGQCVFLDHGLGVHTQYMHMDEILVENGQMVEAGQIIGRVGATGRVTAAHLHFGLSILDLAVDPTPLFGQPTP